jgi:general secretion pathway protein K
MHDMRTTARQIAGRPMHYGSMHCQSLKRQRGVAIITALLIVTIATTISITISTRLQLDVRRTGNLLAQDQADFYLLAAERWSGRILKQDLENSTYDGLDEDWAIELPPIPVDGGSIQGKLTDLHACININNLRNSGAIDPVTEQRLQSLFQLYSISTSATQAMTDWMDADLNDTNPGGAEDGYYLNLESPYRVANTTFSSVSELRLVRGFEDSEKFRQLSPHLCAYEAGDSSINVNTADAVVLKSLASGMTDEMVDAIIEQRKDEPFEDINQFFAFQNLGSIITEKKGLSVKSSYFKLRTQARIGQANKVMYSIIHRDEQGVVKVLHRTQRTL